MMPLVSVIITVYNRIEYISEAIESVLRQRYKNYEIIVVDDGSTIGVKQVLEPYSDKIEYQYQEHKRAAAARNSGIKHSSGKYLAFLDDDDLFEPQKLEIQVPILENNPEVGLVYSENYFFETTVKPDVRLYRVAEKDGSEKDFAELFFLNSNVCMPVCLIRRDCFEDVGLFDESLPQHEDGDMVLRIALRWQVKFSDYPCARVRIHARRGSLNRIDVYRSLIASARKILKLHPDFRRLLGEKGNKRMADLHYSLAWSYFEKNRFYEARKEYISCIRLNKIIHVKAYAYIFVLFLGPAITRFALRIRNTPFLLPLVRRRTRATWSGSK